ncbi:unnamed protein product [Ambrosiozyma monospora]|uniref:Unnamed protein product n=1 Tax=Ambrosiozyma monospora TaxID=43982 RepID=A0ACB5U5U1_AMBMO|nr:unnamed protein product [Ambrosiozyma monospora]
MDQDSVVLIIYSSGSGSDDEDDGDGDGDHDCDGDVRMQDSQVPIESDDRVVQETSSQHVHTDEADVPPPAEVKAQSHRADGNMLPMMTGYLDKFRPEFSLMACSRRPNLENCILESMKDDVYLMGKESESKTFLVDLRLKEIKLLEVVNIGKKDGSGGDSGGYGVGSRGSPIGGSLDVGSGSGSGVGNAGDDSAGSGGGKMTITANFIITFGFIN